MRCIAVCGEQVKDVSREGDHFEQIELDGAEITCGLLNIKDPDFDSRAAVNKANVLVNIKGFSCNYRDKALIFSAVRKDLGRSYYVVGSEFVGQVVDVGPEVRGLAVGDKVIANNCYTGTLVGADGALGGIPTNHASKEYQVFHQSKLIRVPTQMPDTIAAAFSLNSQTAYSMLRKLNVKAGSKILVTAAKSNVSIFVVNALKKYDVEIFATSTSSSFETQLKELGIAGLIKVRNTPDGSVDQYSLYEGASGIGLFDSVIDPFFDTHFGSVLGLMAPGGKYVTCGLSGLKPHSNGEQPRQSGVPTLELLMHAVLNNLVFIGNCLGSTEDLSNAIRDFADRSYNVVIDSVCRGNQIGEFFNRTYSASDRFGKVVYEFD